MSYTSMVSRPNYDNVVDTVVGAVQADEKGPEGEAKMELLNHLLLERYGMDMGGRLGINSSRGKLALIYIHKRKSEKLTEAEKAKAAVKEVDAIITAFNKALDTLRLPKTPGQNLAR